MARIHATGSAYVPAPPDVVYALLADYHDGHPRILPRPPFGALVVEEGGVGEGTLIRFTMRASGKTHTVRARITEPEPGRVLAETSLDNGAVTTFTVDPEGDGCRVTIATDYAQPGVRGAVERLLVPPMLQKVYADELRLLAEVAAERTVPVEG
jgi:hypothetical protein